MNKPLLATLAATIALLLAPFAKPVVAASGIQRCESADGTLVYTDRACGAFRAKAVPMSGQLLTRIAREEALSTTLPPSGMPSAMPRGGFADADVPLDTGIAVSRRSASGGCARTQTQLAMDLRGALALGDVNRVAESYHWAGMSSRQADRVMDRLQQMTGKPVIDTHYFDARISSSPFGADAGTALVASSGGIGGDAGVMQVVMGNASTRSVVDFDVHKYAGCYFVKF